MKEKVAESNQKMDAIGARIKDSEKRKIQYLRELEACAAVFRGNIQVERKYAKDRAAAEVRFEKERREANQMLLRLVVQQRAMNAQFSKTVKDAKAKMVKNSADRQNEQEAEMRAWMEASAKLVANSVSRPTATVSSPNAVENVVKDGEKKKEVRKAEKLDVLEREVKKKKLEFSLELMKKKMS